MIDRKNDLERWEHLRQDLLWAIRMMTLRRMWDVNGLSPAVPQQLHREHGQSVHPEFFNRLFKRLEQKGLCRRTERIDWPGWSPIYEITETGKTEVLDAERIAEAFVRGARLMQH